MSRWKYAKYVHCGQAHKPSENRVQNSTIIWENDNTLLAVFCACPDFVPASEIGSSGAAERAVRFLLNTEIPPAENASAQLNLKKNLISQMRSAYRDAAGENSECSLSFAVISKIQNMAMTGKLGRATVSIIRSSAPFGICDSGSKADSSLFSENAEEELKLNIFNLDDSSICGFILSSAVLDGEICFGGSPYISRRAQKYFNALLNKEPGKEIAGYIEKLVSYENSPYTGDISAALLSRAEQEIDFEDDPSWLCTCKARNSINRPFCGRCGTKFNDIYGSIEFDRYGGKVYFFRTLNKEPKKEAQLLRTLVKEETGKAGTAPAAVNESVSKPAPDNLHVHEEKAQEMMYENERPSFFSGIVFKLLIVFLCLLVGFAGYRLISRNKTRNTAEQTEELTDEAEEYSEQSEILQDLTEGLKEIDEYLREVEEKGKQSAQAVKSMKEVLDKVEEAQEKIEDLPGQNQ